MTPHSSRKYRVDFSYQPPITARSVHLAGSFNGWDKKSHPLRYDSREGRWKIRLILSPGRYTYKFVLNGQIWKGDQENPLKEKDGFGGFNSIFVTGPSPFKKAKKGDGKILVDSILHLEAVNQPPSGVLYQDRNELGEALIRLRVERGDIEKVSLWCRNPRRVLPLKKVLHWEGYDYYEGRVALPGKFSYLFLIQDGPEKLFYTSKGPSQKAENPFHYSPTPLLKFKTPDWLRDSILYQIFPERFKNGNTGNDPPKIEPWGARPTFHNFFGGDIEGVIEKLPYLEELGINGLYFNPLFKAPSSHKYDTSDYLKIDPHFGGQKAFDKLEKELKKRGMRLVLDGVFNHTGTDFFAFADLLQNQKKSRYQNWYFVRKFPVRVVMPPPYEAWWGFAHHPQLNPHNPATRHYLMKVATHWVRKGSSGWRLDVPNEIAHDFWKDFRKKVKSANPEAYIVGEIWEDGRPWLQGDEFDGVMNYTLRKQCIEFFARQSLSPSDFLNHLSHQRLTYPQASLPAMMNLLSSHDVPRFLTLCGGTVKKAKMAAAFQMTYQGVPCIYYGEEIGMKGGKDPENRRCFPWSPDNWNRDLRQFYRQLMDLRKKHPEFRRGLVESLFADDSRDILILRREWKKEVTYVIFHRGKKKIQFEMEIPGEDKPFETWEDLLNQKKYPVKKGRVKLDLPGLGVVILKGRRS